MAAPSKAGCGARGASPGVPPVAAALRLGVVEVGMMSAAPAPRGGFNPFQFLLDWYEATRILRKEAPKATIQTSLGGFTLAALKMLAKG